MDGNSKYFNSGNSKYFNFSSIFFSFFPFSILQAASCRQKTETLQMDITGLNLWGCHLLWKSRAVTQSCCVKILTGEMPTVLFSVECDSHSKVRLKSMKERMNCSPLQSLASSVLFWCLRELHCPMGVFQKSSWKNGIVFSSLWCNKFWNACIFTMHIFLDLFEDPLYAWISKLFCSKINF